MIQNYYWLYQSGSDFNLWKLKHGHGIWQKDCIDEIIKEDQLFRGLKRLFKKTPLKNSIYKISLLQCKIIDK